ncbi:MAG: hypothetical protein BWY59_02032 [Verrucomicrobia bacterium ADurb.Bin345]|nr:MAG: hypothetical protein BWY59_02032 [Verrucomicrobia bacterium ADurb.Bin345]
MERGIPQRQAGLLHHAGRLLGERITHERDQLWTDQQPYAHADQPRRSSHGRLDQCVYGFRRHDHGSQHPRNGEYRPRPGLAHLQHQLDQPGHDPGHQSLAHSVSIGQFRRREYAKRGKRRSALDHDCTQQHTCASAHHQSALRDVRYDVHAGRRVPRPPLLPRADQQPDTRYHSRIADDSRGDPRAGLHARSGTTGHRGIHYLNTDPCRVERGNGRNELHAG